MSDFAHTPARAPPPGLTSNLIDPASTASKLTAANVVAAIFVFGVVIIRLYTRAFIVRSIGVDDYICILALLGWIAVLVCFVFMVRYGLGKHLWDVSVADLSPHFLLSWNIGAVCYSTTILLIKLSILALYRRLFPINNFAWRWWLVTLFTIGYSIGGICSSIFACDPIRSSWDITIPQKHCVNTAAFYIANGSLNSLSDLLILALPIPIVWSLAMSRRKKITLSIVFAFGSLSCIISIIRLQSIIVYLKAGSADLTNDLMNIVIWSQVEISVGMVCACVPTLKPFFDRYIGSGPFTTHPGSSRTASRGNRIGSSNLASALHLSHQSHRDNDTNVELGNTKKSRALVSVDRADSDTESTDQIIKADSGGVGASDIMVHTAYHVDWTRRSSSA